MCEGGGYQGAASKIDSECERDGACASCRLRLVAVARAAVLVGWDGIA